MTKRECGSCSFCCKVLDVPAVYKPAGKWCKHFTAGQGCGIHQLRPKSCREFACLWLKDAGLDDAWKPSTSKFVLSHGYDGEAILLHVDPQQKNAWKLEPYYTALKALSGKLLADNQLLMIVEPSRRFVLTPDSEIEVGAPDLVLGWQVTSSATRDGQSFFIEFEVMSGGAGGPTRFETPAPAMSPAKLA